MDRLPWGVIRTGGRPQLIGTPRGATDLGATTSPESALKKAEDEKHDDVPKVMPTIVSPPSRNKISAFVVSYNRASIIESCLRSLRFVDELSVIDKSSDDGTAEIARRYADKVVVVPWTPTVEETRHFALGLCSHDLIVYLDDDECLSSDAIRFIWNESTNPSADVYPPPFHNYFLGRFDSRTRDWPAYHERFFRKHALELPMIVHAPVVKKLKKKSVTALAEILSSKEPPFDLIYVDGSHQASDALADSVIAFQLLRVVMIFDDYLWCQPPASEQDTLNLPKAAIDSFINLFQRKLRVISGLLIYQLYIEKIFHQGRTPPQRCLRFGRQDQTP